MVDDDAIALMISTAYSAPHLDDLDSRSFLKNKEVLKLVEMYESDVRRYIAINRLKPVSADKLSEDVYILCNDMLIYIGRFNGGYIPSKEILRYKNVCHDMISLHTHPVPLPLPTLEDVISTQQIGYNIECVLSKINKDLAEMVCIKPVENWNDVVNTMSVFIETIFKMIDRYVIIENNGNIMFVPYPTENNIDTIEKFFANNLKGLVYVDIVKFDMKLMEYIHSSW